MHQELAEGWDMVNPEYTESAGPPGKEAGSDLGHKVSPHLLQPLCRAILRSRSEDMICKQGLRKNIRRFRTWA